MGVPFPSTVSVFTSSVIAGAGGSAGAAAVSAGADVAGGGSCVQPTHATIGAINTNVVRSMLPSPLTSNLARPRVAGPVARHHSPSHIQEQPVQPLHEGRRLGQLAA